MLFLLTVEHGDEREQIVVEASDPDDAFCADLSDLPPHWDPNCTEIVEWEFA